jgi:hypothetical protein
MLPADSPQKKIVEVDKRILLACCSKVIGNARGIVEEDGSLPK